MTIYKYSEPFNYKEQTEYCGISVITYSESCVRVNICLWECLSNYLGHKLDNYNYSPQTWMDIDNDGNVTITPRDFCGMCQLYCLLDNFNSYYGAVEDEETLTILSVGSSLTHQPRKDGWFNLETMSEGFGVVINKLTNDIVLVALGESSGNYWGKCKIPYRNLSVYDRNEVIRIVNDVPRDHFWNKDKLIEILWKKDLPILGHPKREEVKS